MTNLGNFSKGQIIIVRWVGQRTTETAKPAQSAVVSTYRQDGQNTNKHVR